MLVKSNAAADCGMLHSNTGIIKNTDGLVIAYIDGVVGIAVAYKYCSAVIAVGVRRCYPAAAPLDKSGDAAAAAVAEAGIVIRHAIVRCIIVDRPAIHDKTRTAKDPNAAAHWEVVVSDGGVRLHNNTAERGKGPRLAAASHMTASHTCTYPASYRAARCSVSVQHYIA